MPGRLQRDAFRMEITNKQNLTLLLRFFSVGVILESRRFFQCLRLPRKQGYAEVGLQTLVAAICGCVFSNFVLLNTSNLLCGARPALLQEKNIGGIACAEIGSDLFSNQGFQKLLQEAILPLPPPLFFLFQSRWLSIKSTTLPILHT